MKKWVLILLACSMLSGCASSSNQKTEAAATEAEVETTEAEAAETAAEESKTAEIVKHETERVMASAEETQPQVENGWKEHAEGFQYLENGVPAVGWRAIDGEAYYFDQNGWMQTGEKKLGYQGFTFDASGHLRGIQRLENSQEETVYYYGDGKYILRDGNLYWEDSAGSRNQIFDWEAHGMSGFSELSGEVRHGIMDFTVADGKIYATTTEGLAYMQLDGTECKRIGIEGNFPEPIRESYGLAADHGRMYYCMGIEGVGGGSDFYYAPQIGVMSDGSYTGWGVRSRYDKMQAAGERNGFLAVKTITESDMIFLEGAEPCDRRLVWVTEAGEQVLVESGVDEYLFCGNSVWYMKDGQLQKADVEI